MTRTELTAQKLGGKRAALSFSEQSKKAEAHGHGDTGPAARPLRLLLCCPA